MTKRNRIGNLVLTTSVIALTGFAGCQRKSPTLEENHADYYTCGMHPSIKIRDAKAKCPLCGMDLTPVLKKDLQSVGNDPEHDRDGMTATGAQLNAFTVPLERQQQIGVTYAATERKPLCRVIRAVGRVALDRTRYWEFVARVEGYVQKLHVTSPGEAIEEGQPLLTIYSPELSAAEREYVNLLDARDRSTSADGRASTERAIEAAHRRLEARKITGSQISELENARKPSESLTLHSPFKGVVEEVAVEQGRRMMIGDRLVTVADLSVVWVWAEFHEDELSMIGKGQKVRVTAKAYPGQTFEGELSLISPFLGETKRTAKARIDIANPNYKLLPGMYVNVELSVEMGEGLTIPVSAALPTGSHAVVFVSQGGGKLERRIVQVGMKYGDRYEVLDGLAVGERVVTSANFLIDAESKLQGVAKSFDLQTVKR
jgi:Cu(I)/Ag(I) efflux system membrane fusion protein